jgi:hypothetical protein
MTYTGAPCGAHLSEFDVDRSSDGDGESRSAHTPKVVRRWEISAPKSFGCADFMEPSSKLLANEAVAAMCACTTNVPARSANAAFERSPDVTGFVLIAWSASFTFVELERFWKQ